LTKQRDLPMHPAPADGADVSPPAQEASDLELVALLSKYGLLFIMVGLLAAFATWWLSSAQPALYTSVAYLRIDEPTARNADAIMRTDAVLDAVNAKAGIPGNTIEERRRWLDSRRTLTIAPGEGARDPRLFRQDVVDVDPVRARGLNAALIEAWLARTKPPPFQTTFINTEIARLEDNLKLIDKYLEQVEKDTISAPAILPKGDAGTIIAVSEARGSAIATLLTKRDETKAALAKLQRELQGTTRDAVFSDPSLPEEAKRARSYTNAVLAVIAAETLLLILILSKETGWIRWRRRTASRS